MKHPDPHPHRFAMHARFAFFVLSLVVSMPAWAAGTLEQEAPAQVLQPRKNNIWSLVLENDLYGGGTDSNYTNGVRLTYLDLGATIPKAAGVLDDWIPGFEINPTTSVIYSLGQNLYTPRDIRSRVQDPNDRPWAAFLYGSMALLTLTDNHTDEIELTAGVVGPAALGRQAQTFVHRYISDSPIPRGWNNQLKNEPALMLGWQRTWPRAISGDVGRYFRWSVAPYAGATVGNVYTYADTGLTFRFGPDNGDWQDTPPHVRPSMPGTGFFAIPENKWSWYAFAGLEGRAVARNIFLDGNTFATSHSVDKKNLVGDANAGIALTFGQARLSYTATYRTKEFDTQEKPEVFGSITLGYRF